EILTAYDLSFIDMDYLEGGKIDIHIKANNSIGFSAQPGGYIFMGSPDQGRCNLWWTNTQLSKEELGAVYIGFCGEAVSDNQFGLSNGIAIRTIKSD
ncbi:MAG TPA: hypothetical protein VKX40_01260, partial [Aequorivita sp.]|nr:hypothetical protein [Aequorivita sp.]